MDYSKWCVEDWLQSRCSIINHSCINSVPHIGSHIRSKPSISGTKKMFVERRVKVAQLSLTLCNPMDYTVHGILQDRILEWKPCPSQGDLPNPGIKPRSPTLQVDSSPAEPQQKPESTGVGRLPLLQQIFPTQELNRNLLYCRQILYQLSYQGSP